MTMDGVWFKGVKPMQAETAEREQANLIVVMAQHEEEISAEAVDLFVTVEGSSLVTGSAALRKAKEVSRLVEALEGCGVESTAISLEGILAEVKSGLLARTSSATYRLRVRCSLDVLPDALGAVTSAKQAHLQQLDWIYPESAEQQAVWLASCVAKANLKAEAVAKALGASLMGIHRITEYPLRDEQAHLATGQFEGMALRGRAPTAAPIELGFELAQKKRDGRRISAEYRVRGFKGG